MIGIGETSASRNAWPQNWRTWRRGLVCGSSGLALALAASAASAQAPQVTVYLGNYGEPASGAVAAPVGAASPPPNGALGGQTALAQLALYQQYLLYLAVANAPQARGPAPDVGQYFTNGAVVTTVPSAGQPGASYFSNGAEATRLPLVPPAPSAAAAPPPSSPPPRPAPPPQPWWWVEPDSKQSSPPAISSATAPPPAPSAAPPMAAESPGPPMSFEEWLQSMGAAPPEAQAEVEPASLDTDEEAAPVAESAATAYEVRQRVSYADREKPRERIAASRTFQGWAALVIGAFGVGLLMGAFAMRRARHASAARPDGASADLAPR